VLDEPSSADRVGRISMNTSGQSSTTESSGVPSSVDSEPSTAAAVLFGDRLTAARRYAELLADTGVTHGLIGPREGERVWRRHVLNCAVLTELIEPNARLLDVGSGAGLPGIPLALARPDLEIVLLEPMSRRVDWLNGVVRQLDLPVTVVRGRAEEAAVRREWAGADVVTARAVAPLAKLAGWALPLLRPGGRLLAVKGASASDEVTRDHVAVRDFGGLPPRVVQCGGTHVDPPTTVVVVERTATGLGARGSGRPRRRR
jgi:16S rRNA (guanine527-N7)-methyltransferase